MYTDRLGVTGFFNPDMGGDPIAYQHLFWFTFHPEVYIFFLPSIGMLYEIIPTFSRKPYLVTYSGVIALVVVAIIGFGSWAHHMFATGMTFTGKDCVYGRNAGRRSRLRLCTSLTLWLRCGEAG